MNTSFAWIALVSAALSTGAAAQAPMAADRAAGGTVAGAAPAQPRYDDQVTLVIHTAVNCPICKVWRESATGWPLASQLGKDWPQFQAVFIERPSLHGSESEALYPQALRHLFRARQESYQLSPATPMFEIVRNKQVVARQAGLQGWSDAILPSLRQLQASQKDSTPPSPQGAAR
jgi:hypothetical protein